MCSLVRTGWKPTNGTCILAKVPTAYHDENATYKRLVKRPMSIRIRACNGIMFVMKA
jgi:SOS-response transcriptional repressor LexA